jgi:hypothetical protein
VDRRASLGGCLRRAIIELGAFSFDSSFSRCIHSTCRFSNQGILRRRTADAYCCGSQSLAMTFLSRVLRLLFWLLVLSWGARLLKHLVAWMMRRADQPTPRKGVDGGGRSEQVGLARRLVRDPLCGVHVAEVLAIPLRDGSETLHFCSVNCRDEYARRRSLRQERLAANG